MASDKPGSGLRIGRLEGAKGGLLLGSLRDEPRYINPARNKEAGDPVKEDVDKLAGEIAKAIADVLAGSGIGAGAVGNNIIIKGRGSLAIGANPAEAFDKLWLHPFKGSIVDGEILIRSGDVYTLLAADPAQVTKQTLVDTSMTPSSAAGTVWIECYGTWRYTNTATIGAGGDPVDTYRWEISSINGITDTPASVGNAWHEANDTNRRIFIALVDYETVDNELRISKQRVHDHIQICEFRVTPGS